MVNLFNLALLLSLGATDPVVGVVRVAHEGASVTSKNGIAVAARPGDLVRADAFFDTGPTGWAEIHLPRIGRLRISLATEIRFVHAKRSRESDEGSAFDLHLLSGRIWLQTNRLSKRLEVRTANTRCVINPGSSVIAEHTPRVGTMVATRRGSTALFVQEQRFVVEEQHLATVPEAKSRRTTVRFGGSGLTDLVVMETRRALGDLSGLGPFLLARTLDTPIAISDPRGTQVIVRSGAEVSGSDTGPAGALLEDGIRPPAFFETEVPPKGPNVNVEVSFSEE